MQKLCEVGLVPLQEEKKTQKLRMRNGCTLLLRLARQCVFEELKYLSELTFVF
jgi:hypothetical protein